MCSAVRFKATGVPKAMGACHCEMCRRWSGSAFLEVTVPLANIEWEGAENIARLQSSDWAERTWCAKCGSPLYYHVTMPGPMSEEVQLSVGLFDDPSGFEFDTEIFIDCKPDSFAYAGEGRKTMTRAEMLAMFAATEPQ